MGRRVLFVGLCCVDVVSYVEKFPKEDSDTRVFEQRTCLGGNATNSANVFNQLAGSGDDRCELFTSLLEGNALIDGLIAQSRIDVGRSPRRLRSECPISTVIVNKKNGSRTILHYRGCLPEPSAEEFSATFGQQIRDGDLDLIHFEGRNFDQVYKMMQFARANGRVKLSVELEKLRPFPCLEQLVAPADIVFVSKDFAQSKGWNSMESAVEGVQQTLGAADKTVICAWGEKGAAARAPLGHGPSPSLHVQAALSPLPGPVMDTLGAGDCFNGTALLHLCRGKKPLDEVIAEAVRVAGTKCTRMGLMSLADCAEAEQSL